MTEKAGHYSANFEAMLGARTYCFSGKAPQSRFPGPFGLHSK